MSPPPDDDFAELYRADGRRLVVQLNAYTQDPSLAEDLVHEAFCRALDRWARVSRYEDPVHRRGFGGVVDGGRAWISTRARLPTEPHDAERHYGSCRAG